jgi:hypothetical protein
MTSSGQILEQQHADDLAAVRRLGFAPVRQHADHDRGGRHRERAGEDRGRLPGRAERGGERGEHRDRDDDL